MDDTLLRNHVDSLRFRGILLAQSCSSKWLILFEKHATANSSANGNELTLTVYVVSPTSTLSYAIQKLLAGA